MSKFGFYTDCHLTNHHIRTDNYSQSILNKLTSIYNYAKQNDFDFMTFGGDFFHTNKVLDMKILVTVCQILKQFGKPTYVLIGNHDIYGNSLNGFHDSTLNLLCTILPDLFIPLLNPIQLQDIIIYGCNTFNDLDYTINQIVIDDNKFQLLLDHHMIYDKGINGTTIIHPKQIGQNSLDLILSGHVHMGYKLYSYGRTSYYNPGSLSRTSKDLKDLKVSMAIIQTNKKNFKLSNYYPQVLQGGLIFKQNIFSGIQKVVQLQKNQQHDIDSIQSFKKFQQLKYSSSSIFQLLQKLGIQHNTDKQIIKYINKFKK